jgi:hypothetical protein
VLLELTLWFCVFLQAYFSACELALPVPELGLPTPSDSYSSISATLFNAQFGPLCLLFMLAQALPLFFELAINLGPRAAARALLSQILSFSWAFFCFQAQLTGYSFRREISTGGAAYMATGRGMATLRVQFHSLYQSFTSSRRWSSACCSSRRWPCVPRSCRSRPSGSRPA